MGDRSWTRWTQISGAANGRLSQAPQFACVGFLVVGTLAAWWFRGTVDQGETKGLRAQIDALEQRLKLAAEQEQAAIKATQSAKEQLDALEVRMGKALVGVMAKLAEARRAQEEVLATLLSSLPNILSGDAVTIEVREMNIGQTDVKPPGRKEER